MPGLRRSLVVFTLLTLALRLNDAKVLLVYSVHRHGARNVLPKNATLQEPDTGGGPSLLPEGQRQCYSAGAAYQQRYLDAAECPQSNTCLDLGTNNEVLPTYGLYGSPGVSFHAYNSLFRSSSLSRTLQSMSSFLTGLFPPVMDVTSTRYLPDGQQVVPVYSQQESEDYVIRGYTRCPTYDQRLLDWYTSDEFLAMEQSSAAVRNLVGDVADVDVSLTNWWNVYDQFNVWRKYHVGTPLPDIPEDLYQQVVSLANWLETAKMRHNLTGNLIGGALLADMLTHMSTAVNVSATPWTLPVYYRLVAVSSHYNTQLGLLAALNVEQGPLADSIQWLHTIPNAAAVLAFELHSEDSNNVAHGGAAGSAYAPTYYVRAVAQDGPASNYTTLPLPCAVEGSTAEDLLGPGSCTWDDFLDMASPAAIPDAASWCRACDNTATTACQLFWLQNSLEA